jgi:hypothetical protein
MTPSSCIMPVTGTDILGWTDIEDSERARRLLEESLEGFLETESRVGVIDFLYALGAVAGSLEYSLQTRKKRRGWDSNPRDDLTPPTRFPIALLRPTRTPVQKRRAGV